LGDYFPLARILFLGDIVGQEAVDALRRHLGAIRSRHAVDWVVANAENAANGSGLIPSQYRKLRDGGVDGITLGDHAFRRREICKILQTETAICRPANYPKGAPGKAWATAVDPRGRSLRFWVILGRVFMKPVDCPFGAIDEMLRDAEAANHPFMVDLHAEATGEKKLLGVYLDGKVVCALGTHTHVPTADEEILPGGTAFLSDVGMTGPSKGVLGRKYESILSSVLTGLPQPYEVAQGNIHLCGALVEWDEASRKTVSIQRVREPVDGPG
jgi:metallophosphoesterase (TIGR00282 family)